MIIDADKILNGLMWFYITGAIIVLILALIAYPSLRERTKKSK